MIFAIFFAYKIISGKYDKQNYIILKIKEVVPTEIKNKFRGAIYDLRFYINKGRDQGKCQTLR